MHTHLGIDRKLLRLFFISSIFISFNIDVAFGQGNIKVGDLEVHPAAAVKETYNSNLFSEADGSGEKPDTDWFTTVTPGIDIKYPGERLKVDLGYKVDIERYSSFTNENTEKHEAKAKVKLTSPSMNYSLTIDNNYKDTKDPAGSDEQSNADLNRADRTQNILKGEVEIKLGELARLKFDTSNDYGKYDLSALKAENKTSNTFGGSFYYKFWPKTSATINYHYGTIGYRDATVVQNSDSKSHTVRAGIAIDPTAKLSGEATFGSTKKDFTQGTFNNKDANTYSVDANLNWQARERTKVNLTATRSIEESSFGEGSSFTRSSVELGLTQNIGAKITGKVDGSYALSEYPSTDSRDDDKITVKVDLKYDMQEWLSFSVNYDYQNNDSNLNSRDYKIHKAFFLVKGTF